MYVYMFIILALRILCNHLGSHWLLFQFYGYGLLVYDTCIKGFEFSHVFGKM